MTQRTNFVNELVKWLQDYTAKQTHQREWIGLAGLWFDLGYVCVCGIVWLTCERFDLIHHRLSSLPWRHVMSYLSSIEFEMTWWIGLCEFSFCESLDLLDLIREKLDLLAFTWSDWFIRVHLCLCEFICFQVEFVKMDSGRFVYLGLWDD